MDTCTFCGRPLETNSTGRRAVYHPSCKKARNFLDAFQRALVEVEGFDPERALLIRRGLMTMANSLPVANRHTERGAGGRFSKGE